ncbi:MAG: O-antigen ligase family protein [Cyanobacteriota bacterium]
MDILQSSYLIKFINKIDLSDISKVDNSVKNSLFSKLLTIPIEIFHPLISRFTESSLFAKNIDYLILANLLILLIAITFSSTAILGILAATLLLLTIIKWFIIPGEKHNFTTFDIPIAAYILIALISVAFSSYFMPSLKGLAKLLVYFAIYVIGTNIFKGKSWKLYFILIVISLTGGFEALYGIYQKLSGVEALATWQDPDAIKAGRKMSRVYGSIIPFNPNLLAGYLLAIFPCAFGLGSIFALKKRWHWSILFTGLSLAALACIVFTGSRGAYIGVAAMGLSTYLFAGHIIWKDLSEHKFSKYFKWGWLLAGAGAIAVILMGLMFMPALQDRILSIFTLRGNSSNSFRMNVYLSCLEMFKDNWLIGIGIGNTTFRLIYGFYMTTGFDALGAYSVPLEVAVEMGIIGLLVFIWMFIVFFSNALKTFASSKSIEIKLLIATIFTAIVGMSGQGIFDTIWYRPQVHMIFWLLIAILACIVSRKVIFSDSEQDNEP